MNLAEQVQEALLSMEESINNNCEGLPTLLRTIHKQLKSDPEIVTLLSESECAILVNGLKEHTKIELATKAIKSKPKTSLKNMTVEDL